MRFTRVSSIEQALQKLERKFPQFRDPNYQPSAEQAEAHREYKLLQAEDTGELLQGVWTEYVIKPARERRQATDRILERMGLASVAQAEAVSVTQSRPKRSLKAQRGETCEKVIREVKFLHEQLWNKTARPANFQMLCKRFPDMLVLELLSGKMFDEDDRDLVMSPRQWGVKPATYAIGILKRFFGVEQDAIKSYRAARSKELKTQCPSADAIPS